MVLLDPMNVNVRCYQWRSWKEMLGGAANVLKKIMDAKNI
jgi:hypothetical protein